MMQLLSIKLFLGHLDCIIVLKHQPSTSYFDYVWTCGRNGTSLDFYPYKLLTLNFNLLF